MTVLLRILLRVVVLRVVLRILPMVLWLLGLMVALGGLLWLRAAAAAPAFDVDGWTILVRSADSARLVVVVLTYAALGAVAYLLLATIVSMTADLLSPRYLRRLANTVTPRALRHMTGAALGVGLAASMNAPVGATETLVGPPVMTHVTSDSYDSPNSYDSYDSYDSSTFVLDSGPAQTVPAIDGSTSAQATIDATPVVEALQLQHSVEPGESLWTIAREVLSTAQGRTVSNGEVQPYWHELIELNRPLLKDPDTLRTGQVINLPVPIVEP